MGQVWLRGIRGQGRSQADQGIQDVLPQCAQGLWVSQASSTSSGLLASWENFLQYFFFNFYSCLSLEKRRYSCCVEQEQWTLSYARGQEVTV